LWSIGQIILNDFEIENVKRIRERDVDIATAHEKDEPSVDDLGTSLIGVELQGTIFSKTRLSTLKGYAASRSNSLVDVQEGLLLDNCEDLALLGTVWAGGNGATVALTTTKKIGTNSIGVQGAATDYPHAIITFPVAQDWEKYDELDLWVAPLNDDSTPATEKDLRIFVRTDASNYVYYNKTLDDTEDQYTYKRCELNDSGEGDDPAGSTGTIDWGSIGSILVQGQYTDNDKDFAFDHLVLSRKSDYFDGQYKITNLEVDPVHPLADIGGWGFSLSMAYKEALA